MAEGFPNKVPGAEVKAAEPPKPKYFRFLRPGRSHQVFFVGGPREDIVRAFDKETKGRLAVSGVAKQMIEKIKPTSIKKVAKVAAIMTGQKPGQKEWEKGGKVLGTHPVVLTVRELGFPNGATLEEIYERAKKWGLELCPPEISLEIETQRIYAPIGEESRILYLAMEPLSINSKSYVFRHDHIGDKSELDGVDATSHWNPDDQFAFF